jgi:hypothetical protein
MPAKHHADPAANPVTLRSAMWRTVGRTAAQALNRIEGRWP